jgi:hypothetical protein
MKFKCFYCGQSAVQLVPDRIDEVVCLSCGKVSRIPRSALQLRADKLPPTG